MKTYRIVFEGRVFGAIGIFYQITKFVMANSEDEAIRSLSDNYEFNHIEKIEEYNQLGEIN